MGQVGTQSYFVQALRRESVRPRWGTREFEETQQEVNKKPGHEDEREFVREMKKKKNRGAREKKIGRRKLGGGFRQI